MRLFQDGQLPDVSYRAALLSADLESARPGLNPSL